MTAGFEPATSGFLTSAQPIELRHFGNLKHLKLGQHVHKTTTNKQQNNKHTKTQKQYKKKQTTKTNKKTNKKNDHTVCCTCLLPVSDVAIFVTVFP